MLSSGVEKVRRGPSKNWSSDDRKKRKNTNPCVVKVKTLWGCPKNLQEQLQKKKKTTANM